MHRDELERWRRKVDEKIGPGTAAGAAVEAKQWELAAMHMLLAAVELLDELGAPALEALLDELELDLPAHRGSRASAGGGRAKRGRRQ